MLIARHSPATGYELSVYASLPPAVWGCLVVSMAGGIAIAAHQAFAGRTTGYWILAMGALWVVNLTVLLLPLMRGYYLYASGDTILHWRWVDGIIVSGHIQPLDMYPITHIWAAEVAQMCGLPPRIVVGLLPVLSSVLFAGSSYLLANEVLPKKSQAMLAGVGASTLFFGYYHVAAYPQALSMMMLPLTFYLYFKRSSRYSISFRVLFVILLLLLPFSHPATAVLLIACLIGAEIAKAVWRLRQPVHTPSDRELSGSAVEPVLISLVTFLMWISAFAIFGRSVRYTLGWLSGELQELPRVAEIQSLFATQGLGILQQVELAMKMYGDNLVYLMLSFVALIIVFREFLHRKSEVRKLFILSAAFLTSGPAWIGVFVATLQITVGRLIGSNFMMWAAPVLAGFALHRVLEKTARLRVFLATSTFFCAAVVAVFGVYHSPFMLQPSWQILLADAHGTDWFLTYNDPDDPVVAIGVPPAYASSSVEIPEHFGYDAHSTLGASFEENTYLLLTERFRIASLHPVLSRVMISDPRLARPGFNRQDFDQLVRDPSVDKLYTNGELDAFLIGSLR
jgi:hypothetical protein